MQNLIYDEAPYDILYYDSNLDVYRNDRFAGWQNMPANGTPLFSYGDSSSTTRCSRTPRRSRRPRPRPRLRPAPRRVDAPAAPTSAPSASTGTGSSTSGGGSNTTLLLAVVVIAVVVVVGWPPVVPASRGRDRRGRVAVRRSCNVDGRGSRSSRPSQHHPGAADTVSGRYIVRKLLGALVTIVAIVILNFVLFRMMPGSPERATKNPHLTPEFMAAERANGASTSRCSPTS